MSLETEPLLYEYDPGAVRFGRECVDKMCADFAERGFERALIITGRNVGANDEVMQPLKPGLEGRLAGVFAQNSPEQPFYTAYDALERVEEDEIGVLVGAGAGVVYTSLP